jgi:hypothetical protein
MSLKAQGTFVVKIQFAYFDKQGYSHLSKTSSDITAGKTREEDPGDLGVPDGSLCYMKANVVAGKDRQATRAFIYKKDTPAVAKYKLEGTLNIHSLKLTDVAPPGDCEAA